MFDNKIDKIETQKQMTLSHHVISTFYPRNLKGRKMIFWLVGVIVATAALFIILEIYSVYASRYKKKRIKEQVTSVPNYFESLKRQDCEEFVEDEDYFE